MVEMTPEEFEECVGEALDAIPEEFAALIKNVVVLVEDHPPPDQPQDLLGLYDGTPLTERYGDGGIGELPDRITIFRLPTLAISETKEDVADEVATTVIHEVAHYFGIEEDRIHELGWG
ncbi:MAG: metallopeptidase family protein [Bifidobacteriaceae bacterium]|jgi:predicted Zn-dependent protease with MMP-like domain|nr:metallopeptidase family protein [Bifidobacteriaceae bacterium]